MFFMTASRGSLPNPGDHTCTFDPHPAFSNRPHARLSQRRPILSSYPYSTLHCPPTPRRPAAPRSQRGRAGGGAGSRERARGGAPRRGTHHADGGPGGCAHAGLLVRGLLASWSGLALARWPGLAPPCGLEGARLRCPCAALPTPGRGLHAAACGQRLACGLGYSCAGLTGADYAPALSTARNRRVFGLPLPAGPLAAIFFLPNSRRVPRLRLGLYRRALQRRSPSLARRRLPKPLATVPWPFLPETPHARPPACPAERRRRRQM